MGCHFNADSASRNRGKSACDKQNPRSGVEAAVLSRKRRPLARGDARHFTFNSGGMLLQFCYFYNPVNETPVVTQGDGGSDSSSTSTASLAASASPAPDRA